MSNVHPSHPNETGRPQGQHPDPQQHGHGSSQGGATMPSGQQADYGQSSGGQQPYDQATFGGQSVDRASFAQQPTSPSQSQGHPYRQPHPGQPQRLHESASQHYSSQPHPANAYPQYVAGHQQSAQELVNQMRGRPGSPSQQPPASQRSALVDGEWHRVHRLTLWSGLGGLFPLLVGVLVAVPLLITMLNDPYADWDDVLPTIVVWSIFAVSTLAGVVGSFIAYRTRQFRVGADVFELREGWLNKKHRHVRLDRIQSINITRPFLAMVFGLSAFEVDAAGDDANIQLRFLGTKQAEQLRRDVLDRASGLRRAKSYGQTQQGQAAAGGQASEHAGAASTEPGGAESGVIGAPAAPSANALETFIEDRLREIADDGTVRPGDSIVHVHFGRVLASKLLDQIPWLIVAAIVVVIFAVLQVSVFLVDEVGDDEFTPVFFAIFSVFPLIMILLTAFAAAISNAVSMSRFTIAGSPDGIRIGRGLTTRVNDTLPPGRIHAIELSQPLLWRPFKWWKVRVSRAASTSVVTSTEDSTSLLSRDILLPVGSREDALRVVQLAVPTHANADAMRMLQVGMHGRNRAEGDPMHAVSTRWGWMHPFSVRRLAFRVVGDSLVVRSGALKRRVALLPTERIQGVSLRRSIVDRMRKTASVVPRTVGASVASRIRYLADEESDAVLDHLITVATDAAARDTSHRWAEATALSTVASAHMVAQDANRKGKELDQRTRAILQAEADWRRAGGQSAHGYAPPNTSLPTTQAKRPVEGENDGSGRAQA